MRVSTKERGSPASASGGRRRDGTRGGVRADTTGEDVAERRGGGDRGGGEGGHPRGGWGLGLPREGRGSGIARGRRHVGRGASAGRAGASRGPASSDVGRRGAPRSVAASPTPAIGPSLVARATDTGTGTTRDESAIRHYVAGPRDRPRCAPPVPRRASLQLTARLTEDPSRRVPRLVQHHSSRARVRSAPSARLAMRAQVAGTASLVVTAEVVDALDFAPRARGDSLFESFHAARSSKTAHPVPLAPRRSRSSRLGRTRASSRSQPS